jgi:carbon-monoxide dehydrogenase small subunit
MILSAKALLDENPKPSEWEVKKAIAGNLCRCGSYKKIVEAIMSVVQNGECKSP